MGWAGVGVAAFVGALVNVCGWEDAFGVAASGGLLVTAWTNGLGATVAFPINPVGTACGIEAPIDGRVVIGAGAVGVFGAFAGSVFGTCRTPPATVAGDDGVGSLDAVSGAALAGSFFPEEG